eukprot:TRINITY_DN73462_c0_g1_i1.p1 TRINITY_DN73462_c0_g1~~TRINITY_DN73462_c0_g1_i1.p1  ORF type:complete len:138 (+),score=25.17 TRINITY_DN73462_c0_g1_i1:46-459(+)
MVDLPTRPFQPSPLITDERFEHRTCGMDEILAGELRSAIEDPQKVKDLCQRVLERLPLTRPREERAVVVVASVLGRNIAEAGDGENPSVVIWLIPDPADIDCKQTTFVKKNLDTKDKILADTYKQKISDDKPDESAK